MRELIGSDFSSDALVHNATNWLFFEAKQWRKPEAPNRKNEDWNDYFDRE
jgi:hypothetical protein